ncbi:RNA polymerase sigma factor [Aeromicrobium sp. Leaf350]|uniref:RNA polymerase sigma factor n=1 Tax=Aeromicrobium sp. Leaf350 TaxID=2876565 RepID=UPI001E62F2AA|nr:sigma-70 family RNA polymerase sigma factor [Aeromicrobium sp. Leaf350]
MDDVTDATLIGRARSGDRQAFGQLYDRHVRPVFWQAYAVLGEVGAAEDAAQETFVTAWRKLGSIPAADSALPWLLVTARYVALNARRGDTRRQRRSAEMPDDVAADDDVEATVEAADVRAEIAQAVAALSPTDRELYELCLEDGLTYAEAAEQLGLTHASVRNRLSRLRARLRSDLRAVKETA